MASLADFVLQSLSGQNSSGQSLVPGQYGGMSSPSLSFGSLQGAPNIAVQALGAPAAPAPQPVDLGAIMRGLAPQGIIPAQGAGPGNTLGGAQAGQIELRANAGMGAPASAAAPPAAAPDMSSMYRDMALALALQYGDNMQIQAPGFLGRGGQHVGTPGEFASKVTNAQQLEALRRALMGYSAGGGDGGSGNAGGSGSSGGGGGGSNSNAAV